MSQRDVLWAGICNFLFVYVSAFETNYRDRLCLVGCFESIIYCLGELLCCKRRGKSLENTYICLLVSNTGENFCGLV